MTELKTLKDISTNIESHGAFADKSAIDFRDEIKEEAIKWVKEDRFSLENGDYGVYDVLTWWMKRLNITEEELK